MRLLVSLVLALTVALTSVTMAQARHHARMAQMVELCTGTGMIVLPVDAQGNPTGRTLPCPECTPALAALPGTDRAVSGLVQRLVPLAFAAADRAHPPHPTARHRHARAPPVPV